MLVVDYIIFPTGSIFAYFLFVLMILLGFMFPIFFSLLRTLIDSSIMYTEKVLSCVNMFILLYLFYHFSTFKYNSVV